MQKINPCLWFDKEAEEAAQFYTSVFAHSKIDKITHYGEAGAAASGQKKDSVMTLEFELEDQKFLGLNGGPHFKFTPAVSFFVWCEAETEIDALWGRLFAGGSAIWELKEYPWAKKYGWCEDKFGVSWQLILGEEKRKIAPAFLFANKLLGKGEDAISFYLSVFENSEIKNIHRDPNTNSILHAHFLLAEQDFVLMEGEGEHSQVITPAISFVINCKSQEEVDHYWEQLSQGGSRGQCGWLTDRFGVSWQIVPIVLGDLLSDPVPEKREKVMKAMLKMQKLEIAILEKAGL